jgi:hypothetical protein
MRTATRRIRLGALLALALAGCGYTLRPPFDKSYKTVFLQVRSQSYRKDIHLQLMELLQKEIQIRTPYKIVGSPEGADAILEGFINYADKNIVVESPNNLPRHLNAMITAELKFYSNRPGADPPPAQGTLVTETASFYPELGETATLGFKKAMDKMVQQIVGMMELPWASGPDALVEGQKGTVTK